MLLYCLGKSVHTSKPDLKPKTKTSPSTTTSRDSMKEAIDKKKKEIEEYQEQQDLDDSEYIESVLVHEEYVEPVREDEPIHDDYNFETVEPTHLTQETETDMPDRPNEPGSPVLDSEIRQKLLNMSQSLDSTQLGEVLGYLDLKLLLRGFAKAVLKHIHFSKGYLFLLDLKVTESQQNELNFTYNLDPSLKMIFKKKTESEEEKVRLI